MEEEKYEMAINQAIEKYHKLRDKPIYHFNTMWEHVVGMWYTNKTATTKSTARNFSFYFGNSYIYGDLRGLLDIHYEREIQKK